MQATSLFPHPHILSQRCISSTYPLSRFGSLNYKLVRSYGHHLDSSRRDSAIASISNSSVTFSNDQATQNMLLHTSYLRNVATRCSLRTNAYPEKITESIKLWSLETPPILIPTSPEQRQSKWQTCREMLLNFFHSFVNYTRTSLAETLRLMMEFLEKLSHSRLRWTSYWMVIIQVASVLLLES